MREQGVIKKLDTEKYFGFIRRTDESSDVFFHGGAVLGDFHDLVEGDLVEFEVRETEKGPRAIHVQVT